MCASVFGGETIIEFDGQSQRGMCTVFKITRSQPFWLETHNEAMFSCEPLSQLAYVHLVVFLCAIVSSISQEEI